MNSIVQALYSSRIHLTISTDNVAINLGNYSKNSGPPMQ